MSSRQDPGVVDEMADSDMEYFFDFEAYFRHENAVDQVPVESALGVLEAKGAGPDPSEQVPTNDPAARDMGTVPHAQMQPGRAPAPQLPDPRYSGTGCATAQHCTFQRPSPLVRFGYSCQEPACPTRSKPSKARFKTHAELQRHIRNIHTNPLVCPEEGCPRREPFGRKRDLERHREYEHGGSTPHVCQHDGCANIGKDFKRADRLKAHALACHR